MKKNNHSWIGLHIPFVPWIGHGRCLEPFNRKVWNLTAIRTLERELDESHHRCGTLAKKKKSFEIRNRPRKNDEKKAASRERLNEAFLPGDLYWGENVTRNHRLLGDLQPGEEKVRLNHLVGRCEIFDRVPEANASRFYLVFVHFVIMMGRTV